MFKLFLLAAILAFAAASPAPQPAPKPAPQPAPAPEPKPGALLAPAYTAAGYIAQPAVAYNYAPTLYSYTGYLPYYRTGAYVV